MKKYLFSFFLCIACCVGLSAQVKVIAHRGYWDVEGSAQNSLAAISKADEIGCFGSEFDVWMTKDGELVVNHDRFFKGVNMLVSSYKSIRKVVLDNGEPLPSLDEYLSYAKMKTKLRLVLELKSLGDSIREYEAAAKVASLLKKHHLLHRTDVIAFSFDACMAFRSLLPDTKVYYLNGDLKPSEIKQLGLSGIDYSVRTMKKHPEWVKEAHSLGLEVNVWTVNKKSDMEYFIQLGVDYITTNNPLLLQKEFISR